MENLLSNYDLVVAISQNEINSQFNRLFMNGFIKPRIVANAVSKGIFGDDDPLKLSSYIRGYINAPQVELTFDAGTSQVLFDFSFNQKSFSLDQIVAALGVTDDTLKTAFKNSPDKKTGLLKINEDIVYFDESRKNKVLNTQSVYYWLEENEGEGNRVTKKTYSIIPVLCYIDPGSGHKVLASLNQLKISFLVRLNHMDTTVAQIKKDIENGILPKEFEPSINKSGFTDQAFSIKQLFLDFDAVDYNQLNLNDPSASLGHMLNFIKIKDDNNFIIKSLSLSDVIEGDSNFLMEFKGHVENAFKGQNLLIGVSGTSKDAQKTKPDVPPTLVPTYISFAATLNQDNKGLSAINYQVLCGDNSDQRIPKHSDQTVVNISNNFIVDNNFSGEILFSSAAFFYPLIYTPVTSSINTGAPWSANGNGRTWLTNYDPGEITIHSSDNTTLGTGMAARVLSREVRAASIVLQDNEVLINGKASKEISIVITIVNLIKDIQFTWKKKSSVTWSDTISMAVDNGSQLSFTHTPAFPFPITTPTETDFGAKAVGLVQDIIKTVLEIFSPLEAKYFKTMEDDMTAMGQELQKQLQNMETSTKSDLLGGTKNNFISPTGKLMFLNNPRFNTELDLQMDITYSV